MKIKALIIDDEPLARDVIFNYSKKINNLEIVCSCEDAANGLEALSNNHIDLIFLDINMPGFSGITFLKTIKNPPLIIFTTAYTEYAIESYELNAVDYLKKPFSFERFLKAVQKVDELLKLQQAKKPEISEDFIYIKANKKTFKIKFKEIFYIEGLGDYIKIHQKDHHLVTNLTMKKINEILPESDFLRIHKSYIISLDKIDYLEGNMVVINKNKIPVGNSYRQEFNEIINKKMPD